MKFNKKLISVFSLGFLVLSGCKETDNNKKTDDGKKEIKETELFSNVTEFTAPVDMHTEAQKAFVAYKDGYENLTSNYITTNYGCDGRKNLSAPAGIPVSFDYDDEDVKYYMLEVCKDNDFAKDVFTYRYDLPEQTEEDTEEESESTLKTITSYNLEIGQKYFYRIGAFDENNDAEYSLVRELETADIAPRNLNVGGMTNCRDLGGRHTVDGGRIKQGLLFRTAALDDSQSGSIVNEEGKAVLKDVMKVKTEIELRGGSSGNGGEAKKEDVSAYGEGMNINFKYVPFAYSNGKNLLFRNIEPVKKTFDVLGDTSNYPVFFHCRIGTDRTGLIALLVNALLGVELQEIYQDYLFSDFGCIGKVPTVGQANEDSIAEYVEELKAFPGEKLQNKVYNFLLTAGVPAAKLDNMINFLTEEGSVKGNDVKKVDVTTVDKMTTTLEKTVVDTTKDFNSTTRSPANYVTFNAKNQKVTYTFSSDKAFTADLYANLCSKTTSGSLDKAFKVTLNDTEITVENTSFDTKKLGFDKNIECWIPSKLGSVSVKEGNNTIEIESLTTTSIKFSQFAFSSMSEPANIA